MRQSHHQRKRRHRRHEWRLRRERPRRGSFAFGNRGGLRGLTGTTVSNNVAYAPTCSTPVSGSITTSFVVGTNGNPASSYASKSETLTFTGCGTATLNAVDGTTESVAMNHCLSPSAS